MIDVQQLFLRIQDLARKDKGGYLTPDEFNRNMLDSQHLLYRYYFEKFEKYQAIPEALRIFVVPVNLALSSSGAATLPADFQRALRLRFGNVVNVTGSEPTIDLVEATPLHAGEVNMTLSSAVRKPNLAKRRIYFRVISGVVQVYSDQVGGQCEFEYLRTPVIPVRGVTLDVANDQYNYNAGTSVQIEFEPEELPNFVDLMLLHYGIETRQSEVIQWAQMKSAAANQISK